MCSRLIAAVRHFGDVCLTTRAPLVGSYTSLCELAGRAPPRVASSRAAAGSVGKQAEEHSAWQEDVEIRGR